MRFPASSGRGVHLAAALLVVLAAGPLLAVGAAPSPPGRVAPPPAAAFFEQRVRPVLLSQCASCHGEKLQQGGLRVDSAAALRRGGASGPAVVPGKAAESLLIAAIEHRGRKMPPGGKLSPREIADLTAWVEGGAPWPDAVPPSRDEGGFWAFRPVRRPAIPAVAIRGWAQSPVDAFILAGLEARGLRPAPPADRRTLLRRVTYDLTGLPPTAEETRAFLEDRAPGAWERVVDRLLASPRYGEKWGRHWLDVARYADSNGLDENLAYAHAYRYRDYVIRSFNADLPYDRFVREQLAGDLLPPAASAEETLARRIATGFLSLGPKMLAEDDPVKMEMDIVDEQVDTVGRAFMGMTLGCARCHDHKYDPISTADYYALAGIFKSTRTMENFNVVARWHEFPLVGPEERRRLEAHEAALAERRAEADRVRAAATAALLDEQRRRAGEYLLAAAAAAPADLRLVPALQGRVASRPQTILLEAEQFARGNLGRATDGYGEGIGVIFNSGTLPNQAEWDVSVESAGLYQLDLRFAAQESRPMRLVLNGQLVRPAVGGEVTGGWFPDRQAWHAVAVLQLRAGANTLRLERDDPFPHLDQLALTPWSALAAPGQPAPRTVEDSAAERGLVPELAARVRERLAGPEEELPASLRGVLGGGPRAAAAAASVEAAVRAWRELRSREPAAQSLSDPELEALRRFVYGEGGPFGTFPGQERYFAAEARTRLAALAEELAKLQRERPELPMAMGVEEGRPANLRIHVRGSHLQLGPEVPRRFPSILAAATAPAVAPGQSGRLELAQWLTSRDHPLTARVMVNRVWHWHFGRGLVRSPDNFGRLGERPTHPELLDWLASTFVAPEAEGGLDWSLKKLHRLLLLTSTYRMSSRYDARAAAVDPENRLRWRWDRRRLQAEEIRDSLLAVTGELDLTMGGTLLKARNREYVTSTANINYSAYDVPRRSVYLPVVRSAVYEVFQAFDFPDPSTLNGERATTTVAPQALFMLNSDLVLRQSRRLAQRLAESAVPAGEEDAARVRAAYEQVLGRSPTAAESGRALAFVQRYEAALRQRAGGAAPASGEGQGRTGAWAALCRVLLASSEFVYVE